MSGLFGCVFHSDISMAMLSLSSATQPRSLTCGRTTKLSKLIVTDSCKYGKRVTRNLGRMDIERSLVFGEVSKNMIKDSCHNLRVGVLADSTLPVIETVEKLSTYLFRTEKGGHVKVVITRLKDDKYGVEVEVSYLQLNGNDGDVVMSWGIFRSDSSSLISLQSSDSGIFETPFTNKSLNKLSVELEFDASLAPFYVSFLLKSQLNGEKIEIRSHRNTNFCFPIGIKSGYPSPLGLSYTPDGFINFALFSRTAKSVVLCLFDDTSKEEPALEIDLDPYVNRSGDIWHASMDSTTMNFTSYGYRCKNGGQDKSEVKRVLLDPYSKVIGENFLGKICSEPAFDWSGDIHPRLSMEKLMVYRLNITDFTKDISSNLSNEIGGTFLGVSEKLHHFKNLGINAILLEPIVRFDNQLGPYFPIHFFSPHDSFGTIKSMKEMVKKLHANGIEILLEVVLTHTSQTAPLTNIDNSSYYFAKKGDDLETKSTLNCAHPVVQQLILDSLRYWVIEYHIDGFCFVNASSMLKGFNGENLSRPPLIEAIAFDPILSKTKLIADSFDPFHKPANEIQIQFPHWKRWAEMNTNFCKDVRNYLRGESLLSNLATRLCGSGDIFLNGRGPAFSFNFVTRNHGFSLVDLVSFSSSKELSWNCGEEGATKKKSVLETRLKQIRNFFFILYISLGVPVLNMGDECGRSSGGGSCDRKPFNWKALQTGFGIQTTQFVSFLSAIKIRRSDLLQSREFLKVENIDWYGSDLSPPDWEDPMSRFLAMRLKVDGDDDENRSNGGDIFVAINGGDDPVSAGVPLPGLNMVWVRLVDTALPYPRFFSTIGDPVPEKIPGSLVYEVGSHSCVLLEARRIDD